DGVPGADAAAVVHPLPAVPLPDPGAPVVGRSRGAGEPEHHRGGAGPLARSASEGIEEARSASEGSDMPVLSEALREKIRAYFPRYPNRQAVTLPALHLVHDEMRCVPLEAIREIADLLDLSPAEVNDTMSFYGIFRPEDNKIGRTRLWVCRG